MSLRLSPIVQGPEEAETLVFLQGWPDDATLWEPQVAALSDRYRCVRTTMPNFDGRRTARWGHDTDEIVAALAQMIGEVCPGKKVTLIAHDWGCYWAYRLFAERRDLIGGFAALDIAPHVEAGPLAILGVLAYQGWLITAFLLGGPIGDWMTRTLARALGAPMPLAQIHSGMNYPYRNAWRDLPRGRGMPQTKGDWPQGPVLFVYGKRKPFPFHSPEWIDYVEGGGGSVFGLDCGHWVSTDPAFEGILETWLGRPL
ncbi:MAG: alpha/beta fold hydrolase [Candidatus Binatia bacterium]|nr:alpha/beta fold hydrolase [Candidatus Binatia bacterium]